MDRTRGESAEYVSALLPIASVKPVRYDQSRLAMLKLLQVIKRSNWPTDLRFVIRTQGADSVTAGWLFSGCTRADVEASMTDLTDAAESFAPWLSLGPRQFEPAMPEAAASTYLRPVQGAPIPATIRTPNAWAIAQKSLGDYALIVNVPSTVPPDFTTSFVPDHDLDARVPVWERWMLAELSTKAPALRAQLQVICTQPHPRDLVATLLAEDNDGITALEARGLPVGAPIPVVEIPENLLAHIMAIPARLGSEYNSDSDDHAEALFEQIEAASTPHLLILGGSGQGKSKLLIHLAARAARDAQAFVAVDVHDGELTQQSAAWARIHGQDPYVVRLAELTSEGRKPGLHLTRPPAGMDPRRWVAELYSILRHVLWADVPIEYFGPVGERSVSLLLEMLVTHQDGPQSVSILPKLLDPGEVPFRGRFLGRLTPELANRMTQEIMPMLSSKEAGNSAAWLISKFQPLLGQPALLALMDSPRDTVAIEAAYAAGRAILIHVPLAEFGDAGARTLVAVLLHRIWLAVRAAPVVTPLHVIVDEWQRYSVATISSMLAEGRKYGIKLRLANQSLAQLSPTVRDTALDNVGTLATFRTGPRDAEMLDGMFQTVTRSALQTLKRHHLAVAGGDEDLLVRAPKPLQFLSTESP